MIPDIILTGAAGFIGSNLTKKLLSQNFTILGIDNFSDYYSKKIKLNNISEFQDNKNFNLLEADLAELDLDNKLPNAPVIIHLAAQAGVRGSWGENFRVYVKDNVIATQRLLEFAKNIKCRKFIFASSSSVYGDTDHLPMNEKLSIPKPVSPYGSTKLMCENLCEIYKKNFGLESMILRFFSVYGPGQRPDMAFFKLIKAGLTGEKFTLFGDGTQTRDFTFIDDITTGIIKTLKFTQPVPSPVFNLGGGNQIDMLGIIKLVQEEFNDEIEVVKIDKQKGDVKNTLADINKSGDLLDYQPRINIEDGIKIQIDWMKNNKKILV